MEPDTALSIIIPANNEAAMIADCLLHVLASDGPSRAQIIVAANGCTDQSVAIAKSFVTTATHRDWQLVVLDLEEGNKLTALNAAEQIATGKSLVYLDADVTVSPPLLRQIAEALDVDQPRYASGALQFSHSPSLATRLYARTYARVPFIANGLPGAGLFAVNRTGRALWGEFPKIISDDTYVRLLFSPDQRVRVEAPYQWPLVDGFSNLVRVRRRQNAGVEEIAQLYPELLQNDDKLPVTRLQMLKLALRNPISFCVYASVQLIVKLRPAQSKAWQRGR